MNDLQENDMFEVVLFSFGFKYGMPEDVTMVWDVRFLPNPYWEENLRHLTGRNGEVAAYVLESEAGKGFMERFSPLLTFLLQENRKAGKKHMVIGIGCTGGHHRSVAVVERLADLLKTEPVNLQVYHRDVEKE